MSAGQQHQFVPKKLTLSVWGMDADGRAFIENMQTVQIAPRAVEVNCKRHLGIGEIVGGGMKGLKSRFRVMSSFLCAKDTFRVLMEDLGTTCMWEKELASPDVVEDAQKERRRHPRWPVRGTVLIHNRDRTTSATARLVDISQGGCYIETLAPAPVTTAIDITLESEGFAIDASAAVRTSHPSIGMGVEILHFGSTDDGDRFQQLLEAVRRNIEG